MRYCPYTNSSPPICVVSRVEWLDEGLKKLIRKALQEKDRKYGIGFSDQAACGGGVEVEVVHEDSDCVVVSVRAEAGCFGAGYSIGMRFVVPKEMIR